MPIRDTDPRESFAPLGAPIRREPAPTPTPRPEPIGNGMFRRPDGTLETRIPPPPAAPAMRQGMWDRDNPRSKLSPCVMSKWDAAMADAGWPALGSVTALHATQAEDWLTITKQVQEMPSKKQEQKMSFRHTQISLKVNVFAGALVSAAAEDLCDLANRTGVMCECDFNGVKVWARPGDDPAELTKAYDEEIQRPAHLYRVAQVPRSTRTADTEGGAKD